ncbi:ATP-binding protein [Streptomyces sp. SID3343]|uniref:NACHT domain-containing protein n=1 Tax=Streptomyces sp. SID3343 TaxID=2690260 RepID=UPI00136C6C13|nr:ATP-binding protein [Streptomyces sp. SID3343]MYV97431.1 ATP-binding protein [Streptomyces sp. SID3343]
MSGDGGQSWRYLYERLGEKPFQQLCGALLAQSTPDMRCYPVGHSDGGRDAVDTTGGRTVIYQVKWSANAVKNPVTWLRATIKEEEANIRRLVAEGARDYYLITSVAGTAVPRKGNMDKLDAVLADLGADFGIEMRVWWRADVDARVDTAPAELKWAYADMLAGHDLIRYLIEGERVAAREDALRGLLLRVIAAQWDEDAKVKFKQVELDTHRLQDLFVDVEAMRITKPEAAFGGFRSGLGEQLGGAAEYLAGAARPFALVRGEPGQGKSTLGQYLCQMHRAAYLPGVAAVGTPTVAGPRMPLRVDLRDYAAWLAYRDPFGDEDDTGPRATSGLRPQGSLEAFLAALLRARSGGLVADVGIVNDIMRRLPLLLVLDGLDEVAGSDTRVRVVEEIDAFTARLRVCPFPPQVVVTTRPNAAELAEPSADHYEILVLSRLSPELRACYLRKWADARGVRGAERRSLEQVFRQRSSEPHIAQLADNPMQLTILLYLIQKRGNSVPSGRTELYTSYMETFLDREAEKTPAVEEHRVVLEEVTAFLGWLLQSRAEAREGNGLIATHRLKREIAGYLFDVRKETSLVEDLFTGVTARVWALTSKVEGTFQFDVQPLREYFAARYLYAFAGADLPRFDKVDVLRELVRRPYWLNTTRFYAGFAQPNELGGLIEGLKDEWGNPARLRQVRFTAWTLLRDGVFRCRTRSQQSAAELFLDPLSVRLINHALNAGEIPPLGWDSGANDLTAALLDRIADDPHSVATRERLALTEQLIDERGVFDTWWLPHMRAAIGTNDERAWLTIGAALAAASRTEGSDLEGLNLDDPHIATAAVAVGLPAEAGSTTEKTLVRAVLDGHCSDVECASLTGFAHDLLRVAAPQHFLRKLQVFRHTLGHDPLYRVPVHHADRRIGPDEHRAALIRLRSRDDRFARLGQARRFTRESRDTVAPWVDTARTLADVFGPCWLAAEIAVIGATATPTNFAAQGDTTPGSGPFGPRPDYGRLVQDIRGFRDTGSWWTTQYELHRDPLSRATWVLALLTVASDDVVEAHLSGVDEATRALPEESRQALILSSSRIGASVAVSEQRRGSILAGTAGLSPMTTLLVAHHVRAVAYSHFTTTALRDLAPYGAAAWPALLALGDRMTSSPGEDVCAAFRAHEPHDIVGRDRLPTYDAATAATVIGPMMARPFDFPLDWILEVEAVLARTEDEALGEVADADAWFR